MLVRHSEKAKKSVSVIGFGGWQLGNKEFWGEMSFNEGKNLVRDAFAKGITFFDTAPGYSDGLSEEIIGTATKSFRNQVFINTKFGHTAVGENFSVDYMESSIRDSLDRLSTDYIDSVLLHNPSMEILESPMEYEKEFLRLKEIGIIRNYGVSIDSREELKIVLDKWDVDVIEIMFNIFHQDVAELFDRVLEKGIMLVIKVPYDSGWLTGKYNKDSVFTGIRSRWTRGQISRRAELVEELKTITLDTPLVDAAIAFILHHKAVTCVIPGCRDTNQLINNVKTLEYKISDELVVKIKEFYRNKIKERPLGW